jgi:hemolysin activation/secretion protein
MSEVGLGVLRMHNHCLDWIRTLALLGAGVFVLAGPVAAEAPQPPSASQVTPKAISPPATAAADVALPEPAALVAPPGADKLKITPSRIVIDGALPRLSGATEKALAPLQGKTITVADLYEIATAVERLYAEHGYPLVRLAVPPQSLKDGQVAHLTLIDGFIETVNTDGLPKLYRLTVRRYLQPLIGLTPVTEAQIERRMLLAGDLAGLTLKSAIKRGSRPGGVELLVEGQTHLISGSIEADNKLSKAFNYSEVNIQTSVNGAFGQGEQAYIFTSLDPARSNSAFASSSQRRVFGAGVSAPLGRDGLKLSLETIWSSTSPLGGFFTTVDTLHRQTATLSWAAIRTQDSNLNLHGSFAHMDETNAVPLFAVKLSEDRYHLEALGADYSQQLGHYGLGAGFTLTQGDGHAGVGTSLSRAAATDSFTKVEMSASLGAPTYLGAYWQVQARGQAVLRGGLPSSQVFSFDGSDGLSALTQGELTADAGYVVRASLSRPFRTRLGTLTPSVYAAGGQGYFAVATPFDARRQEAAGFALQVQPKVFWPAPPPALTLEGGYHHTDSPLSPTGWRLFITVSQGF